MSRFRSVLSDFTLFVPKSSVCCCLRSFEAPDLEILGISRNFESHVNVIPVTIEAKFCVESDFTGLDAAICRNLEDCSDLMKHIGVFFDPIFSRKYVNH